MAKRKLSRQQRWRVEKIQRERAERAQRREQRMEQQLQEGELGPEQTGLVIAHFGQQVEVESADGSSHRCHLRTHLDNLVTGDRVVWREGVPTGVVVAQLERGSLLERPDPQGRLRPVAANIDTVVVVVAAQPEPHANLIDRYLVAAEAIGMRPLLLLNKSDLIDDDNRQQIDDLLALYQGIGYRVIRSSTASEHGLDELQQTLQEHISIFVGQSGVGKSSLVNALLPGTDTRVGALSQGRAKGRHTTTTARLFHFPGGGDLIDSPGIREFGLLNLDRDTVASGFVEFRPHLGHCRFRDCKHEQEPGCALLEALERGEIPPLRMHSYRQIINSLDN